MASEQVGNIVYQVQMDVAKLLEAQRKVNERLEKMNSGAAKASKGFDELTTSINKVAAAVAASIVTDWARAFLIAADNMMQLNARIERLTGNAKIATQTMQSLVDISSATGVSLQDTAKLWENLSTSLKGTGATNDQVIRLTETLQKIGSIGGTSAQEVANALRQFGQSISSGVVRAEEFNSILEQMPELARQIAAGLGVSINDLKQRMLEGKLTAQDALNAIQKQTKQVDEEFQKLPRTLSQANTAFTNSFLTFIDSVNKASGASSGLVTVIDSLAAALDRLQGKIPSVAAQLSDLTSTAEMYERRARTWSWLGLEGWEQQNKALAGLSNRAIDLITDLNKVSEATKLEKNTQDIEIKTTTKKGKKGSGGKSQAQKDAESLAKAQESVNQKLEELRQKAELSASSIGELSRAQTVLNAQQSLGKSATEEQIALAGKYAAKAWDNANAIREQAKAEKERADAQSSFTGIKARISPTTAVDNQFQKDMDDLNAYAQFYPQKIAEIEAARAAVEEQYRTQRQEAAWQELSQLSIGYQALTSAVDSFAGNASNAFTGLLTGSMSVEDAMRSLGSTIINSVVNGFVQMGVDWLKSVILGQAGMTAASATAAAQGAVIASAMAPAAALTSLATGGANAVPAQAGITSTVGLAQALSVAGARKNGGPVTAGGLYQVGESGLPEIYRASTGKQYMIPGDNGRVISNKDLGGGGQMKVNVIINDYSTGSHGYDTQTTQNGDTLTVTAFITDMDNKGPMFQSVTRNTSATPRVR